MSHSFFQVELASAALLTAAFAAVTDLRSRRIPNALTGPVMLFALASHGIAGGWHEAASAMLALLGCGAVFLLFHLAGGMGAGDVKLIAAQACLLGLGRALPLLVYTALAGGVMALGMAFLHGRIRETLGNLAGLVAHHAERGLAPHPTLHVRNAATLRLPYAVAIAAGTALALFLPNAGGTSW